MGEIIAKPDIGQSTVSHHLKILGETRLAADLGAGMGFVTEALLAVGLWVLAAGRWSGSDLRRVDRREVHVQLELWLRVDRRRDLPRLR